MFVSTKSGRSVSNFLCAGQALPRRGLGGPEVGKLLPRSALVEAQDSWTVQTVGGQRDAELFWELREDPLSQSDPKGSPCSQSRRNDTRRRGTSLLQTHLPRPDKKLSEVDPEEQATPRVHTQHNLTFVVARAARASPQVTSFVFLFLTRHLQLRFRWT